MSWWRISFCVAPYLAFAVEWMLLRSVFGWTRRLALFTFVGLLAASKFPAFGFFGGNSFNPELPRWLLFAWGWLESAVWVALPLSLGAALLVLVVRRLFRASRPTGADVVVAVTLASAVMALYGMYDGMRPASVVERELAVDGLPAEFDGYRVLHLSDLHCSAAARRDKFETIVARANACHPDLIVITGDFVDGTVREREHDLEPLRDLRAPDGVWGCLGNHERYWGVRDWLERFAAWNVRILRNRCTEIRRGGASIALGGMDDPAFGAPDREVFAGAPADGFRILLYHRPSECAFAARELGVRLQLSGHTHGGVMPVIDLGVGCFNDGHSRGVYREGSLTLHVSPGTGQWAGFPLRIFNPPEITVLTLRRR